MIRAWIDTETTGTVKERHAIIEIGVLIEIEGTVVDRRTFNCKPLPGKKMAPAAFESHGITLEQIRAFPNPHEAKHALVEFFKEYINPFKKHKTEINDKLMFWGYNARFDYDFMRQWFKELGDKFFGGLFWFPPHDVMEIIADRHEAHQNIFPSFSLEEMTEFFGVSVDKEKLHGALYDIELTRKVYYASKELPKIS